MAFRNTGSCHPELVIHNVVGFLALSACDVHTVCELCPMVEQIVSTDGISPNHMNFQSMVLAKWVQEHSLF